jgi:hypothetical protein
MNASLILDLFGVFFFAVSGSLLAARKGFDFIGSLLLASLASLGGGVARDVIIGVDPVAFTNPLYLVPPVLEGWRCSALSVPSRRSTTDGILLRPYCWVSPPPSGVDC